MNLQKLMKVEKPQFYLDKAIQQTNKLVRGMRGSKKFKGKKLQKSKSIEIKKIKSISKILYSDLEHIEKSFPTIDNLSLFYQDLIEVVIGVNKLKKSLSSMSWLKKKINELDGIYTKEIKKKNEINQINKVRKEFLGRVGSMFKKISRDFNFLEVSRKNLRNFPSIKTNIKTVAIAGYPNVGKSTLLSKLTTAKPEINVYPFTTKSLMLGYIGRKIQIIDTPGTFREDVMKMNYIEKQAFLALRYLCTTIIYVFDLSEKCGYSVRDQTRLFKFIRKRFEDKGIIIYLSKADIIDEEKITEFKRKMLDYVIFYDPKILRKMMKKNV